MEVTEAGAYHVGEITEGAGCGEVAAWSESESPRPSSKSDLRRVKQIGNGGEALSRQQTDSW